MGIVKKLKLDNIQTKEALRDCIKDISRSLHFRTNNPDREKEIEGEDQKEFIDELEKCIDILNDRDGMVQPVIQTYGFAYDTQSRRKDFKIDYSDINTALEGNGEKSYGIAKTLRENGEEVLACTWERWAEKNGYVNPLNTKVIHRNSSGSENGGSNRSNKAGSTNSASQEINLGVIFLVAGILLIIFVVPYFGYKYYRGLKSAQEQSSANNENVVNEAIDSTNESKGTAEQENETDEKPGKEANTSDDVADDLEEAKTEADEIAEAGTLLCDLSPKNESDGYGVIEYDSVEDNFGNEYTNGLGGAKARKENRVEYDLNGGFTTLSGKTILNSEYKWAVNEDVYVRIYADDSEIYSSPLVSMGMEPDEFKLDVSGVKILKIEFGHQYYARVVDAYLYYDEPDELFSTETPYEYQEHMSLTDAIWYESNMSRGFRTTGVTKDSQGNEYPECITGTSGVSTSCTYRIDGQCSRFSGKVILRSQAFNKHWDNAYMYIYCDDVLVFQSGQVVDGYQGEEFDIDLTETKDLTVVINGEDAVGVVESSFER